MSFYEFKALQEVGPVEEIKAALKQALIDFGVRGTIIIANEGYNGMVCGMPDTIPDFVVRVENVLKTKLVYKISYHEKAPFRKIDVKIKPEIVTLKQPVDISLGRGTHVEPREWNSIVSAPDVVVLDARNDYEFQTGSFKGAVNPGISKFSELPAYVAENLDPAKHKRIAMFCTGGIRCEKFAPYMKHLGFEEVYQLKGGILKYLEEVPPAEILWEGECFVFDERVSVDKELRKGDLPDHSQRRSDAKKPPYKVTE